MILLEIIKFLTALIVIVALAIVLIAITIGAWRAFTKDEQEDKEKEGKTS